MTNYRFLAFLALKDVIKNNAYLKFSFDNIIKENDVKDDLIITQAKNLAHEVLAKKLNLFYYIKNVSKTAINKLDIIVLTALLIGTYEIIYKNEKIENYAIVNECVNLLPKKLKFYKGFVNANLKSLIKNLDTIKLPTEDCYKYSINADIIKLFNESFGEEKAVKIAESLNQDVNYFIRVNTCLCDDDFLIEKLENEGVKCTKTHILHAIKVDSIIKACNSVSFSESLFHVEDLSSQIMINSIEKFCDIKADFEVLDCCAAPGGKSITLAQIVNRGNVSSFDIYEKRVDLIKQNAKRMKLDNINAGLHDATKSFDKTYDLVLADVPCIGLGTIRKKSEIRYKNVFDNDTKMLYDLQQKILNNASNAVKENGFLVYSTCSLNKDENENQTEKFLLNHKNFTKTFEQTIFPYDYDCDGFYYCIMKKLD